MFAPKRGPTTTSSIEKMGEPAKYTAVEPKSSKNTLQTLASLNATNTEEQHFSLQLMDLAVPEDPKIAWQYNIPVLSNNEKKLLLDIDNTYAVLLDYGSP